MSENNAPHPGTYPGLIAGLKERPADQVAIEDDHGTVTYGELVGRIGAVAAWLSERDVVAGDTVALMVANGADLIALQLGTQAVGAVGALVNAALDGEALRAVVALADPKLVVGDPASVERLAAQGFDAVATDEPALASALAGSQDPTPYLLAASAQPGDAAFVNYTSGTTGIPKGVILRHDFSGRAMPLARMLGLGDGTEVVYIVTPAYHAMGLAWSSLGLQLGGKLLMREHFSAGRYWPDIRRHGVTVAYHVGTIARMVYNQPTDPEDANHGLKVFLGGGMPADIWEDFSRRFGVRIIESYSASDGLGTITNAGQSPVGSIGHPSPDIEARVVDTDGDEVGPDEPGELVVRPVQGGEGPAVAYYRDDEATREKNRAGWVHTGDLVRRDADGNFWFIERIRHMIRRRGVNIPAAEIERIIGSHPEVGLVAAVAVPSDLGEDEIKVVVDWNGGLTPERVSEIAAELLPEYMRPRYVEVVDEMPMTVSERVQNHRLSEDWRTAGTWDAEQGAYLLSDPVG